MNNQPKTSLFGYLILTVLALLFLGEYFIFFPIFAFLFFWSISQIKTILPALSPSHLTFSKGDLIRDQEFELRLKLNTGKELDTHTFQTNELTSLRETLIQIRNSNPGIQFSPELVQYLDFNLKPRLNQVSITRKARDLFIAILLVILLLPIVIVIFFTLGEFIRPN